MEKNLIAFTDYPLYHREAGKLAPIRKVEVLSFDGNKYVKIKYRGRLFEIKAGYLYIKYGRYGEVPRIKLKTIPIISTDDWEMGS
jgi:hypothetical protein